MEAQKYTSEQIKEESLRWQGLKTEVRKIIVGQEAIVDRILIGLLCNGHVLLEGVPGLAKTTLIKTIATAIGLSFSRIQFTPDLLPSDLIGTLIYNPKTQEFQTRKGPIFANVILADEINRAPAKVQSALLEAMQEHQVTIGDTSHHIGEPFLVLATQNPLDQEGTYHLPEAQVDRFMFKLLLTYPSVSEEKEIIAKTFTHEKVLQILGREDIELGQKMVENIYIDQKITDYIVDIIVATRNPENAGLANLKKLIAHGASPRASLALHLACRAHAFLKKRYFVIPEDVKAVAADVLRHRILLTYEADAESITSDQIVQKILFTLPSP